VVDDAVRPPPGSAPAALPPAIPTARGRLRVPHLLLVTTGRLPSTARIAMELHDAGATVSLIAPSSHPAMVLDFLHRKITHGAASPLRILEAAFLKLTPDAVIACDERSVRDLHALHHGTRHDTIRDLIERSGGPPASFATITSRAGLLELAARLGVRVPASMALPDAAALEEWISRDDPPFVLKADGSWAGFGVRVVADGRSARQAFADMTRPASLYLALREMMLEGNHFELRAWLRRERPAMSVQGHIDGWPANIGVACWGGQILATICAESVATMSATGPSTVARIIANPEMVEAARRIVQALGLCGLIGFDFMIEAATGAAYLIEMNPRSTPICGLRLGRGRDLTEALVARIARRPLRERPARTDREIIAFFPDTWRLDPSNRFLRSGYHDVPWEQPELVRRLMKPELRQRYWLLRTLSRIWRCFHDARR
jgi:hypothetical protein